MPKNDPPWASLPPYDKESGLLYVVIETVQGSRNKLKYDEERRMFRLNTVLPAGEAFPYDFGFIPSTKGQDGDPIDALVLMDTPTFPGCLVCCRLIGVIEARQKEPSGKVNQNDRLITVADAAKRYSEIKTLNDLGHTFLDELEHFFTTYVQLQNKEFRPKARRGPEAARSIIEAATNSNGRKTPRK